MLYILEMAGPRGHPLGDVFQGLNGLFVHIECMFD